MIEYSNLPAVNAFLNGVCVVWLALGFRFIRRGRMAAHRTCMLLAVATSVLFLVSYIIYHAKVGSVPFESRGWIRILYFSILIPHTILAVVMVPMILITLYRALRGWFPRHRRLARVTWPVWMYVSITGVVIYFMLYHLDPRLSRS